MTTRTQRATSSFTRPFVLKGVDRVLPPGVSPLLDVAFGIFVIWTATKLDKQSDPTAIDHASRWYIRWTKRILPVTPEVSEHFFVRTKRGWFSAMTTATPLFLCLIAIEFTDIAFAFDSVPAVIGVTREPILVYAAIMFAVVG